MRGTRRSRNSDKGRRVSNGRRAYDSATCPATVLTLRPSGPRVVLVPPFVPAVSTVDTLRQNLGPWCCVFKCQTFGPGL